MSVSLGQASSVNYQLVIGVTAAMPLKGYGYLYYFLKY
jgi:hypothetical protein